MTVGIQEYLLFELVIDTWNNFFSPQGGNQTAQLVAKSSARSRFLEHSAPANTSLITLRQYPE